MMGNCLRNQYTQKKADPQKNQGPAPDYDSNLLGVLFFKLPLKLPSSPGWQAWTGGE
jgi:hypothetical protein